MPTISVQAIAVSQERILAATFGAGVHVSDDDGQVWRRSDLGLDQEFTLSLAVTATIVYVGTAQGVYASSNNGDDWIFKGLPDEWINHLAVVGSKVFAGTNNGLFVSSDDGSTWSPTTLSGVNIQYVTAFDDSMFVSTWGALYRSTDGGSNWTQVGAEIEQTVQAMTRTGAIIVAGTAGDGVFVSEDNGTTFAESSLPGHPIQFLLVTNGVMLASSYYDGVYSSLDEGNSWSASNEGLMNHQVYSLASFDDVLLAGTFFGGIYRSIDKGNHWIPVLPRQPGMEYLVATAYSMVVSGGNIIAAVGGGNGLLISKDKGLTWSFTGPFETFSHLSVFGDGLYGVTNSIDGAVYFSPDHGETWILQGSNHQQTSSLLVTTDKWYAGTSSNGVFVSSDQGANWSASSNGLTNLNVTAITTNGNTLYAGTNGGGVFLSTDEGASWIPSNGGLLSFSVYGLYLVNGIVIAATDHGIYISENNGLSWKVLANGLSDHVVRSLTVSSNEIYVGTDRSTYKHPLLTLKEFSPSTGPEGATITITGSFFHSVASYNQVKFNGVEATVVSASATNLTVAVPANATNGPISVTTGGNSVSSAENFIVVPHITSFSPDSGIAGTQISISGTSFSTTPTENLVKVNGYTASVVTSTKTDIVAVVPDSAAPGSGLIEVAVDGQNATSENKFCINPSKPTITLTGANTASQLLSSSSTAGNQWFLDGEMIEAATSQSLYVVKSGAYSVQVTIDDCISAFSDQMPLIVTGDLSQSNDNERILVYPNPTSEHLFLDLRKLDKGVTAAIQIADAQGRILIDQFGYSGETIRLKLSNLARGLYIIRITEGSNQYAVRFSKE